MKKAENEEFSLAEIEKIFGTRIKALKAINKKEEENVGALGEALGKMALILFTEYEKRKDRNAKQQYLCKTIKEKIIPHIREALKQKPCNELYTVWLKLFSISARADFGQFLLYYDVRNELNFWTKAYGAFEGFIKYAEDMALHENIRRIILSLPPGCGKSFILDMFSAWLFGRDPNDSILRISYADDNVTNSSKNIKGIIVNMAFGEVFPLYEKKLEKDLFNPNKEEKWRIDFSKSQMPSHYAIPRGGQINGKRAFWTILDDTIKDDKEAQSPQIKQELRNWYWNNVHTRKHAGKEPKLIAAGTVWAEDDLLEDLRHSFDLVETENENIEISSDGKVVSVKIPAIDEATGKNNVAYAHSDEFLAELKQNLSPYSWASLYQQSPIASQGVEFSYELLNTFKELPEKGERGGVYAVLDSNRKGKDFVSMPICQKIDDKFYLIDVLYKKKQTTELYDVIVDKIIYYNIGFFHIEVNIDASLPYVIKEKLKQRGFSCNIQEVYATVNKETRIRRGVTDIRNYIVFPARGVPENTDKGLAMKHLTTYSFESKNKHDDFPDSLSLLAEKYISKKSGFAKMKAIRNPLRR